MKYLQAKIGAFVCAHNLETDVASRVPPGDYQGGEGVIPDWR